MSCAGTFERVHDLRPVIGRRAVFGDHACHDLSVSPAIGSGGVLSVLAGQDRERGRVDLFADARVLDQRVIDIPQDQTRHPATVTPA